MMTQRGICIKGLVVVVNGFSLCGRYTPKQKNKISQVDKKVSPTTNLIAELLFYM